MPDGTGIFWNRRWREYTGLSLEVVRGWGWQDAIHPEDLKEITDKWLGFLASGQPGEVEGRLRRFDGVYRWFLFRAEPLRDESGNIVNWYGTDTDIEDLKRAEAKLRQDEGELRRMTDAIPQTIIVLNPNGKAIYANRVALEATMKKNDDTCAAHSSAVSIEWALLSQRAHPWPVAPTVKPWRAAIMAKRWLAAASKQQLSEMCGSSRRGVPGCKLPIPSTAPAQCLTYAPHRLRCICGVLEFLCICLRRWWLQCSTAQRALLHEREQYRHKD